MCLLLVSGDVYVWGWNESGQLGLPCKDNDRKSPPNFVQCHYQSQGQSSRLGVESAVTVDDEEVVTRTAAIIGNASDIESSSSKTSGSEKTVTTDEVTDEAGSQLDVHESKIFIQDVGPVQVQSEPCGLDLGQDMCVSKVACGSRHTVVVSGKSLS